MISVRTKQAAKRFASKAIKRVTLKERGSLSVILNYHSVHPIHSFSTKPEDFRQQMEYLKSAFTILSLAELYEMKRSNEIFPGRLAVVTFDDGYEDNYIYAFPILRQFGIKATVFLTTGFADGTLDITQEHEAYRGLKALTWEQVLEMKEGDITFGAHTHTHRLLGEISLEEAEEEIGQSKRILQDKLGEPVKHFAYPLGQPSTFNPAIVELLRKHGFETACSTLWGSDNSRSDMFALQRIRIDPWDTIDDFMDKVNGHWDFIRWIQLMRR